MLNIFDKRGLKINMLTHGCHMGQDADVSFLCMGYLKIVNLMNVNLLCCFG